jgi:hypothetical protein
VAPHCAIGGGAFSLSKKLISCSKRRVCVSTSQFSLTREPPGAAAQV